MNPGNVFFGFQLVGTILLLALFIYAIIKDSGGGMVASFIINFLAHLANVIFCAIYIFARVIQKAPVHTGILVMTCISVLLVFAILVLAIIVLIMHAMLSK